MHTIKLIKENRFVFNGLDDDCFMIVNQIEFPNDINIPLLFTGTVYQINTENNSVDKLGDDYVVQTSMRLDAMFDSNE